MLVPIFYSNDSKKLLIQFFIRHKIIQNINRYQQGAFKNNICAFLTRLKYLTCKEKTEIETKRQKVSFSKNTERLYCSHFVTFGSSRGIFSFTELFLMLQWTQLCCECTEDLCDLIKSNKKCLQNIMHKQILLLVSALLARIINVQS